MSVDASKAATYSFSSSREIPRYANVGAPGYLTTAPSVTALVAARCAVPQRDCGWRLESGTASVLCFAAIIHHYLSFSALSLVLFLSKISWVSVKLLLRVASIWKRSALQHLTISRQTTQKRTHSCWPPQSPVFIFAALLLHDSARSGSRTRNRLHTLMGTPVRPPWSAST